MSQQGEDPGSRTGQAGPDIPGGAPQGRGGQGGKEAKRDKRGTGICDESATRREGGQHAGDRWHTLVSCTLTTEYRPVRPLAEAPDPGDADSK